MCYSAKVQQKIKDYYRRFNAAPDYEQISGIFRARLENKTIRIPRAFEANFDRPENAEEQVLRDLTLEYRARMATEWERELFAQKTRQANAVRKLAVKETKAARNDERVAGNKVAYFSNRLADLKRSDEGPDDSRIFPMHQAPIIISEGGANRLVLARYHCRQADKPAGIDGKFPGLYNARRDNIDRFWRNEFGATHALCVVTSFFENVERDGKNVVLQFDPRPAQDMLIACVYARWKGPDGKELLSFAAITDEPPPEVAAAGHDRVIINIKEENVAAWLNPKGRSDAELQAILSDPQRPYYEHKALAA
jgi:putative SOS response-associated peptidase YedK